MRRRVCMVMPRDCMKHSRTTCMLHTGWGSLRIHSCMCMHNTRRAVAHALVKSLPGQLALVPRAAFATGARLQHYISRAMPTRAAVAEPCSVAWRTHAGQLAESAADRGALVMLYPISRDLLEGECNWQMWLLLMVAFAEQATKQEACCCPSVSVQRTGHGMHKSREGPPAD